MSYLLKINDVEFTPIPGEIYPYNYLSMLKMAMDGKCSEEQVYRHLFLNDLFFIVYFVMKVPKEKFSNTPFVVRACKEVASGPRDYTLDIWAREHFKSTIITCASTLQYMAKDPNGATLILSYKKKLAEQFLETIKKTLETESEFLYRIFTYTDADDKLIESPFWRDPKRESPKWSIADGIEIRRTTNRKEPTVYAGGLTEGMPTGMHCDKLKFDDIETQDMAQSPDILKKVDDLFDSAQNLGSIGGTREVVGTPYSHNGPIMRILKRQKPDGSPKYLARIKPATEDGTPNGKSVLLPEDELNLKRTEKTFYAQQLCDPTPEGTRKLPSEMLQDIEPDKIPTEGVIKLMAVDGAGDAQPSTDGDTWCGMVVVVKPRTDDFGALEYFITDLFLDRIPESEGPKIMGRMYMDNGYITMMGVEKTSQSTTEVHIANFLEKKKRLLSLEAKNLMILRPANRNKHRRIEQALSGPLYNAKIHISTDIPLAFRERLRQEFDEFPFGKHDDGMDGLAYIASDMVKDKYVKAALRSALQEAPKEPSLLQKEQSRMNARPGGSEWMRM